MANENNKWDKLLNHAPYHLNFGGIEIFVENGVFTPDSEITFSTSIILENLPPLKGKLVADIGTGTGVLAIKAAQNGARVIATDNSGLAVANASINVRNNRVSDSVTLVKTSLLDGIDEQFDYIFANLPILDEFWAEEKIDVNSTLDSFFKNAKEKLKKEGKIYFPWTSFAEDKREQLEKYILSQGYSFSLKKREVLGYIWYLYIVSKG